MRWLCLTLAGLAFWSASLQINDPDPALWIGLYAAIGVHLLLAAFGRPQTWLRWMVAGACCAMLVWNAPGLWRFATNRDGITLAGAMSNAHPYIEETREFGGALLGLLATLIAARPVPTRKPEAAGSEPARGD